MDNTAKNTTQPQAVQMSERIAPGFARTLIVFSDSMSPPAKASAQHTHEHKAERVRGGGAAKVSRLSNSKVLTEAVSQTGLFFGSY
jgi:hypothetical protein